MAGPTVPSWKRKLAIQREQAKRAIRSEDVSYFRFRVAVDRYRDANPLEELRAAVGDDPNPTKEALDNLNIKNTVENEDAFADYRASTEALKGEKDKTTWEDRMQEAKDKAKERAIKAIDVAYAGAAQVISELPAAAQEPAFNIFDIGQEYVGHVFDSLVSEMKAMLDQIVNFMKGVWDALVNAWNTVVDTVSTVINWIKGIFTVGLPSDPKVPPRTPGTVGDNPSVDLSNITFKLLWQQATPQPLTQDQIEQARLYLDPQINQAMANLNANYAVQLQSPVSKDPPDNYSWEVQGVVPDVDDADVMDVIQAIKKVIKAEDARQEPLPYPWEQVPSPDPVAYFAKFEISGNEPSTTNQTQTSLTRKQQDAFDRLPRAMRVASHTRFAVNGH